MTGNLLAVFAAVFWSESGAAKWLFVDGFQSSIMGVMPMVHGLSAALAISIASGEIVLGMAFLTRATRRWAAYVSLGALIAFGMLKGIMLVTGRTGTCGCWGPLLEVPLGWSIVIDTVAAGLFLPLAIRDGDPTVPPHA